MIRKIETKKFEKNGPANTLLGLILLVGIVWTAREIGIRIWPENIENKPRFVFLGSVLSHSLSTLIIFLVYLPGYLGLSSLHKKYIINKEAVWEWQKPNWNKTFRKFASTFSFNQFLVYPVVIFLSTFIGLKQRFTDFPTFQ